MAYPTRTRRAAEPTQAARGPRTPGHASSARPVPRAGATSRRRAPAAGPALGSRQHAPVQDSPPRSAWSRSGAGGSGECGADDYLCVHPGQLLGHRPLLLPSRRVRSSGAGRAIRSRTSASATTASAELRCAVTRPGAPRQLTPLPSVNQAAPPLLLALLLAGARPGQLAPGGLDRNTVGHSRNGSTYASGRTAPQRAVRSATSRLTEPTVPP
jgi:hypothetical protein